MAARLGQALAEKPGDRQMSTVEARLNLAPTLTTHWRPAVQLESLAAQSPLPAVHLQLEQKLALVGLFDELAAIQSAQVVFATHTPAAWGIPHQVPLPW